MVTSHKNKQETIRYFSLTTTHECCFPNPISFCCCRVMAITVVPLQSLCTYHEIRMCDGQRRKYQEGAPYPTFDVDRPQKGKNDTVNYAQPYQDHSILGTV